MPSTRLNKLSSIPNLLKDFYHKVILNFVKKNFCFYWEAPMSLSSLPFILLMVNYMNRFSNVKPNLHPGVIPTWSWYIIIYIDYLYPISRISQKYVLYTLEQQPKIIKQTSKKINKGNRIIVEMDLILQAVSLH